MDALLAQYGPGSDSGDSESEQGRVEAGNGVPASGRPPRRGANGGDAATLPAPTALKRARLAGAPASAGLRLPPAAALLDAAALPYPEEHQQAPEPGRPPAGGPASSRGGGGPGPASGTAAASAAAAAAGPLAPPRVRTFPHVDGSYPTLVFIKLPQHAAVRGLFARLLAALPAGGGLPRFHPIDGLAPTAAPGGAAAAGGGGRAPPLPLPPHISLSRTVPVRLEQGGALLATLAARLKGARPGPLALWGVEALANDEGTRTFAALRVQRGREQVAALVAAVDAAFVAHGLPAFHREPRPHASFAWALGDHAAALSAALEAQAGAGAAAAAGAVGARLAPPPALDVPIVQVVARVGQREHVVWSAPLR